MPKQPPRTECPYCGAKTSGRWESLTKGLCITLLKFFGFARDHDGRGHLLKDCEISHTEYTNFCKLRYFGIVRPVGVDSGVWELTETGWAFIETRVTCRRHVLVFRNKVKELSDETILITEALRQAKPYWLERADFIPDPRESDDTPFTF